MSKPAFSRSTTQQHDVVAADLTGLAFTETPEKSFFDALIAASPGNYIAGDTLRYVSPLGRVIEVPVIDNGGTLIVNPIDYSEPDWTYKNATDLADPSVFIPGAVIDLRVANETVRYSINGAGGLVEEDFEGGGGGGSDGNGIIREIGYVAAANEVVSFGGELWLHPAGGTVAADMATAGFVNALGGGGAEVDTLASVTARGMVATGDIEIPAGFGLILTDADGERLRITAAGNDALETNPV